MNHGKKPMANQIRKKMEKMVKKDQASLVLKEPAEESDTLTPSKILKKYPLKARKADKSLLDAFEKGIKIKKAKKVAKHSKRTTPGDPTCNELTHRDAFPASMHKEGAKWKKTVDMQNQLKRKILTAKLQKKKGPK